VHLTQEDKYKAIIEDIRDCVTRKQPVLVGTTSIESSELLSGLLEKEGIKHNVLNAKQHEREAHVVAQAGWPGAITIATNMAGRGTDIQLGGNFEAEIADQIAAGNEVDDARRAELKAAWQLRHEEVLAAGGLHIVGTERHESRRIDNQLRGRSGRQGDPGSSRFYLSMEDTLMRIFGDPNRTKRLLQFAGMKEGEVIESNLLTRQIEKAQRKVEAHNFDIRKQLLLFDDVANDQRKVVYQQRTGLLGATDLSEAVAGMREESVNALIDQFVPPQTAPADWDLDSLSAALAKDFNTRIEPRAWLEADQEMDSVAFRQKTLDAVNSTYEAKVERITAPVMRQIERQVVLQNLDQAWREHLAAMDYLRQGIHLRGYAQKDYRYEFKREAFELFSAMLDRVKHDSASLLARVEVRDQAEVEREEAEQREKLMRALQAQHAEVSALAAPEPEPEVPPQAAHPGSRVPFAPNLPQQAPFVRGDKKVGRNEPCPCGSGKKFKQCHGSLSA
jgi:preprotein translocase subunit SecA